MAQSSITTIPLQTVDQVRIKTAVQRICDARKDAAELLEKLADLAEKKPGQFEFYSKFLKTMK